MLFMARVVATHAESHAVDVVLMDDGRRFGGVQVLSHMAGGNAGHVDLPEPTVTDPSAPFDSQNTGIRDIYALVAFVSRDIPVVVGFIYPQVAQCLFAKKNLRINRHASDVYSTIDEAGNVEIAHPSGSFVRIAEALPHVDLAGTDYDAKWKIANNVASTPGMRVQIGNGGNVKATIDITKDGHVSITNVGNTTITTTGTTSIDSTGNMTLHTDGTLALSATGNVNVTGANINLN